MIHDVGAPGECRRWRRSQAETSGWRGQALIEYAILVGAIIVGVAAAASVVYRSFSGQAQSIERNEIVF